MMIYTMDGHEQKASRSSLTELQVYTFVGQLSNPAEGLGELMRLSWRRECSGSVMRLLLTKWPSSRRLWQGLIPPSRTAACLGALGGRDLAVGKGSRRSPNSI